MVNNNKKPASIRYREVTSDDDIDPENMSNCICLGNAVGCFLKERYGGSHFASPQGFKSLLIGKSIANGRTYHKGVCSGGQLIPSRKSEPNEEETKEFDIGGVLEWKEGPHLREWMEDNLRTEEEYKAWVIKYQEWKDCHPHRVEVAVRMMRRLISYMDLDRTWPMIGRVDRRYAMVHTALDDGDTDYAATLLKENCRGRKAELARELEHVKQTCLVFNYD